MPPRSPELRNYRVGVYCVFGVICALVFFQLIRGVVGDLYGRPAEASAPEGTPAACLDELDRLYQQLAARVVEPAPRGLDEGRISKEWDDWNRRWEAELDSVSARCHFSTRSEPAMADLAEAQEALEDLRRDLGRTGDEISSEAGRAKESLAAARAKLFKKP